MQPSHTTTGHTFYNMSYFLFPKNFFSVRFGYQITESFTNQYCPSYIPQCFCFMDANAYNTVALSQFKIYKDNII